MPLETAADLATFFHPDDGAEEATYTPAGGGAAVDVTVRISRFIPQTQPGMETKAGRPAYAVDFLPSEIPTPGHGDTLVVAAGALAGTYKLESVIKDDGLVVKWGARRA